jgi:hypothetical protein
MVLFLRMETFYKTCVNYLRRNVQKYDCLYTHFYPNCFLKVPIVLILNFIPNKNIHTRSWITYFYLHFHYSLFKKGV